VVILKSSLLKLLTGVPSGYIEVITYKLFTRVPDGYIEVITFKSVYKGA
jgi:hypothetical protein